MLGGCWIKLVKEIMLIDMKNLNIRIERRIKVLSMKEIESLLLAINNNNFINFINKMKAKISSIIIDLHELTIIISTKNKEYIICLDGIEKINKNI